MYVMEKISAVQISTEQWNTTLSELPGESGDGHQAENQFEAVESQKNSIEDELKPQHKGLQQ